MSARPSPASSSSSTPDRHSSVTLTPSRKVQALLAQFSDSDSENEEKLSSDRNAPNVGQHISPGTTETESEDDEDDVLPRGRLAARLLAGQPSEAASREATVNASTNDLQSSEHRASSSTTIVASNFEETRLNDDKDANEAVADDHDRSPGQLSRATSPLFFPSPNAVHGNTTPPSERFLDASIESPVKSREKSRPKFLALVEKHRKERLAREAVEVAKRAAGMRDGDEDTPKRARGSSPADDSGEDSASADDGAVKRMQKQARPTRKASKKALEEMHRETQRMNRNMQLAHQATTKNRITKESLLARFNFLAEPTLQHGQPATATKESMASSSSTTSDVDSENGPSTTPATSPLREAGDFEKQSTTEMSGALASGTLGSIEVPKAASAGPAVPTPQPIKVNLAHTVFVHARVSDSDDDIEIVRENALKRKYAAFETMPKRKAKEMPSHLALRSLAYLLGKDDKKRSMNAAELEADLRKRARLQALEERQQKIKALQAKGVIIQTAAEREQDQQEVEDLVERARQEAIEIQKREKELAKKEGTYVKDNLDDDEDDDSEDEDFEEDEDVQGSGSEDEERADNSDQGLVEMEAKDEMSDDEDEISQDEDQEDERDEDTVTKTTVNQQPRLHLKRRTRVVSDDEDETDEPSEKSLSLPLSAAAKTPQSVPRSARKAILGLPMSDDLPMGLSQAFAATMAESQTQRATESQDQDSIDFLAGLPSPRLKSTPTLQRLDSVDLVSDSQPAASQTQPLNINLLSQSQIVPESPRGLGIRGTPFSPLQQSVPFDLTQDNGYILSPFTGNRFDQTPQLEVPGSTIETVILTDDLENSPVLQRRGKLRRGRAGSNSEVDIDAEVPVSAFQVMQQAIKVKATPQQNFDKKKSDARKIVDEAAEESEDEYAGLGGASDDSGDEIENEDDRLMIDEDTQVGKGDEAKLAGLYADRERERDEQEVSKLLKDITTGALRRKRGAGDDLDLSDEEDAAARRREAKRREFARMRRELLKDEAVGKIAEDKKKEAFLRSIEDHEAMDEDDDDGFEGLEGASNSQDQSQSQSQDGPVTDSQTDLHTQSMRSRPLDAASSSKTNRLPPTARRTKPGATRRPATLAEIRDSVSFLIEEPDSQAAMIDLGLSDSEDDAEAYVDLDRHFREAEADENELDGEIGDLGDFVVDDELPHKQSQQDELFKKPGLPRQERAPFSERRTKHTVVVDRLSLLREASSSASATGSHGSNSTKMAFFSSKAGTNLVGVPSLLRRATTNSSLGSMSGRESVSATGVVTSKTERGSAGDEKEFIRKGSGGRRNAVNYQGERKTLREEKMSARAGVAKADKNKKGGGHGFLGGLFRGDSWE